MPRIEGLQLANLIRMQLDAIRQADPAMAEMLRKRKAAAEKVGMQSRVTRPSDGDLFADVLQQRVSIAVRNIPADNPDRRQRAFRAFLETVLLQEFGEDLKSDPAFAAMVRRVHESMEQDDTLRDACVRASDVLLAQAHAAPR